MKTTRLAKTLSTVSERLHSAPGIASSSSLIGICLEEHSGSDEGTAVVSWEERGEVFESRVSSLRGVNFRKGDRVLLTRPENSDELIIVGALAPTDHTAAGESSRERLLLLMPGECLSIQTPSGQELASLDATAREPKITLRTELALWECTGALNIIAPSIALRATRGEVVVSSPEDIVVKGKTIRLN